MAVYNEPKCKLCRRAGEKLFLKGAKCNTEKCPMGKRPYAPGEHRRDRVKFSDYGIRLREKQKTRQIYGVLERQFRNYFKKAEKMKGPTGENLLQLLERRLDNVVYRMGFALSRSHARQLTRHRHFLVNGKIVNIPSYLVEEGDEIKVKNPGVVRDVVEMTKEREVPSWLKVDRKGLSGKVLKFPSREDITVPVDEHLVVELYSR